MSTERTLELLAQRRSSTEVVAGCGAACVADTCFAAHSRRRPPALERFRLHSARGFSMTLDTWAASSRWAVAFAVVWCGACALPRGGTNEDGGRPLPDATADTGVDAGPICDPPDCNDGNLCTDDLCTATGCEHVPNTSSCDDGVFCNGFDTCADGTCQPGLGDPCTAPTVCDESRHSCVGCGDDSHCPPDNAPDWSSCDFGGSICGLDGTQAREVTSYACNLSTHECDATMTLQMEACSRPPSETNGASCVEAASTGKCQGGACCTGCLDGTSCNAGTASGSCGTGGAACAGCGGGTPFCVGGACVRCAGAADCNDSNPCTTNGCNTSSGSCQHPAVADGTSCTGGVCMGGTCVAGCTSHTDCTDPANARCDTSTNTCVPCSAGSQCAHLAATPVCDRSAGAGLPGRCIAVCPPSSPGCLSVRNTCEPGFNSSFCGSDGDACVDCAAMSQTCNPGTHTCM